MRLATYVPICTFPSHPFLTKKKEIPKVHNQIPYVGRKLNEGDDKDFLLL